MMRRIKIYKSDRPKDKVWVRVSKRVDKRAVVRNKIRRRIKEAIKEMVLDPQIVISANPNIVDASIEEIKKDITRARGAIG